jgi:rod shape-determining protein MreC
LRDGPLDLKAPLLWTASIAVIIAAVLGVAILLGDRRQTLQAQAYSATKDAVDTVAVPVGGVMAAPVRWTGGGLSFIRGYFFAVSQNEQLRQENLALERDRDAEIALRNENARLRTLLGMKTDPPIPTVSGLVVTDSRGPFGDTRLVNVGSEREVQIGNPVISEHGLVGRIVGVTRGASRVLLLTDIASRTPVLVARTNARAILTGDGGPNPRLAYLRGDSPVKEGDRILTSGDGGLFPRGLPVGVAVMGLDGAWRVRLDSDFSPIDFVQVLLFKDFAQLVDEKALAQGGLPPLPPAQAAAIKTLEQPTPPPPAAAASATAGAPLDRVAAGAGLAAPPKAAAKSASAKSAKSPAPKAKTVKPTAEVSP